MNNAVVSTPELNHLRAFVAVAQQRNYRRAAQQLGLSPSAVSQAVRRLESHLGVPLLARSTRSVSLTQTGSRLYEQLSVHLNGLNAALQQVAGLSDQVSGTLKLNMPRSAACLLMQPMVAAFLAAYPQVQLEIV